MTFVVALLIFVLVYVLAKFLLSKVDAISSLADVLGVVIAALAALFYMGVI